MFFKIKRVNRNNYSNCCEIPSYAIQFSNEFVSIFSGYFSPYYQDKYKQYLRRTDPYTYEFELPVKYVDKVIEKVVLINK